MLDFRGYLQAELARRIKANPRYSLRAFARTLETQSGFLSKILLGQRRVTPSTVHKFGMKLGLSPRELEKFEQLISDADAPSAVDLQFKQISYDRFQMISDWYHFPILELPGLPDFQGNSRWISKALGISVPEAQAAIERLQRLGYVEILSDNEWKISEGHTTTLGTEATASALRTLQKQILEKAIAALESTSIDFRDQSGMTMAIDSRKLPEAKKKIMMFRRELCAFLESGSRKDMIYQLSVSLFPVTTSEKKRSPK